MSVRRLLCVAVLVSASMVSSLSAWGNDHRAYLTFSQPVRLPGVTLPAGTYTFELALPDSNRDLVRVSSRDRNHVYLTAFTRLTQRSSRGPLKTAIVLGETSANLAQPIRVWYPDGEIIGNEFIY